jgi:hypothetical protein
VFEGKVLKAEDSSRGREAFGIVFVAGDSMVVSGGADHALTFRALN